MRYCNNGFKNYERAEIYIISTDGDRFLCQPAISAIDQEFLELGANSSRALKKNVLVPFSSETIKILKGETEIGSICADRSWFRLERTLDEIAGFAKNNMEIGILRDKIADELVNVCCDSNCFLIHRKMIDYACNTHSETVLEYINYNLCFFSVRMVEQKTIDVQFYRLPVEDLEQLLSGESLNLENEENIVNIINAWIAIDSAGRENFRYFLMSSIRAAGIPFDDISNYDCFQLSRKPKRKPRDALLLLGGWNVDQKPLDCIEFLDLEDSNWKRSELKLPRPMGYIGAAMIDQTLYIFGGTDGNRFISNTWRNSPPKFEWEECDVMHEPRNYITNSAVVFGEKIYVFGGRDDRETDRYKRLSSAECYDPKTDKWSKIANMHDERSDCAAAVHRNFIYICGGNNGRNLLSTVEVYHPQADLYVPIQNLPSAMSGHSMLSHREQLVVVGGFNTVSRLNKIYIWDEQNSWMEQNEKLRIGRSTFSASSYQGCIVIPGGYSKREVEGTWECVLASDSTRLPSIEHMLNRKSATKSVVAKNWMNHLKNIGMVPIDRIRREPIILDEEYVSMDES